MITIYLPKALCYCTYNFNISLLFIMYTYYTTVPLLFCAIHRVITYHNRFLRCSSQTTDSHFHTLEIFCQRSNPFFSRL